MCDFITQSPTLAFLESLLTLLSCVLQSNIWELIEGYGEIGNIFRRKPEWSLLRICISMCECNSQSYTFLFSVQLLTHFSGNLQWDTSERNEPCCDKGDILRWKLERSFVRNFLVMCEFISQSYTYLSCSSPLSVFWGTWGRLLWIALRPAVIKEISSVQIVKEAFWETSFCSLNSSPRVTA